MNKDLGVVRSKLSLKSNKLSSILAKNKEPIVQKKEQSVEAEKEDPEKNGAPGKEEPKFEIKTFDAFEGKGRLVSSGKAVHGQDTKFLSEIKVGDTITVFNSTKLAKETRRVILILSDTSLGINDPFSSNIGAFSKYEVKPQDVKVYLDEKGEVIDPVTDVKLGKRSDPNVGQNKSNLETDAKKTDEKSARNLEAEYAAKWKLKRDKWCT